MLRLSLLWFVAGWLAITGPHQSKPTAADFVWLAGCWQRSGEGWRAVEHWMQPDGGTMLGMSRTVVRDTTREFEFLQLRTDDNEDLFYVAFPSGQKETWFKLVKFENDRAVFENPEHDFPQRIIYALKEDGSLLARIEGMSKGKPRSVDFPMQRIDCD